MDYLRTIPLRVFCTFLAITVIPVLIIYALWSKKDPWNYLDNVL